jgi:hypothetical protein
VTGHADPGPSQRRVDPVAIRNHLADAVAVTEDRLADTLDRIAQTRPLRAALLHAQATRARQYAIVERDRATQYRTPPSPVSS